MAFQSPDQPDEEFRRDRHEHGGMPEKLDDDRLAHEAEEERVEAGIDPFDPDEVPSATDTPLTYTVSLFGDRHRSAGTKSATPSPPPSQQSPYQPKWA